MVGRILGMKRVKSSLLWVYHLHLGHRGPDVDISRRKETCTRLVFGGHYVESCFDIGFSISASRPCLDLLDMCWSLAVRMGLWWLLVMNWLLTYSCTPIALAQFWWSWILFGSHCSREQKTERAENREPGTSEPCAFPSSLPVASFPMDWSVSQNWAEPFYIVLEDENPCNINKRQEWLSYLNPAPLSLWSLGSYWRRKDSHLLPENKKYFWASTWG